MFHVCSLSLSLCTSLEYTVMTCLSSLLLMEIKCVFSSLDKDKYFREGMLVA